MGLLDGWQYCPRCGATATQATGARRARPVAIRSGRRRSPACRRWRSTTPARCCSVAATESPGAVSGTSRVGSWTKERIPSPGYGGSSSRRRASTWRSMRSSGSGSRATREGSFTARRGLCVRSAVSSRRETTLPTSSGSRPTTAGRRRLRVPDPRRDRRGLGKESPAQRGPGVEDVVASRRRSSQPALQAPSVPATPGSLSSVSASAVISLSSRCSSKSALIDATWAQDAACSRWAPVSVSRA